MFNPKTNYAKIAYDAILFFVSTGQVRKPDQDKISADLKLNRACIVSVYDMNDNLRGNYGFIEPEKDNLYDEIIENAIGAATNNEGSEAISASDLNQIKVFVDVISGPNSVEDVNELKPHKHGIILKDKSGKSGFILPNIKGIKTVEQQIEKIRERSGIKDNLSDLDFKYFKITRYD